MTKIIKSDVKAQIARAKKIAKFGGAYSALRKKIDGVYYHSVGGVIATNPVAQKTAEEIGGFGFNVRISKGIGAGGRGVGYYLYVK